MVLCMCQFRGLRLIAGGSGGDLGQRHVRLRFGRLRGCDAGSHGQSEGQAAECAGGAEGTGAQAEGAESIEEPCPEEMRNGGVSRHRMESQTIPPLG